MTDSRKPDAGCPCMAYQDQLPLYARSARVPDERFIPWRFCPWCGRDSRSPIPAQPSPEQRDGLPGLVSCCVRCGTAPAMDKDRVNGVDVIRLEPCCPHIDGFHLWPRSPSVVSPPAEIRLVGMDGQSITYVLPPAAPPSDTEERA